MPTIEHTYAYAAASSLSGTAENPLLALSSDMPQPECATRRFLTARALFPDVTARCLRAVSETVASRFYIPPSMLARILREADPVVTVSPGAVRFEGFSACCSAYMRLDVGDAALDVSHRQSGTTNVDFGAPLRGALATVGKDAVFDLRVGSDAVEVVHGGQSLVEKKVPLPLRWIRGFAEVQIVMSGMTPAFRLSRVAAQKFLRSLPRSKDNALYWVSVSGGLARLSARESAGAVPLRAAHRLRVLEALVPKLDALDVFINAGTGATAWVLDFGSQRLNMVLNADPWQGFSGDGGLLSQIAVSDGTATAAVRAQLHWQDRIDPAAMVTATGLPEPAVRAALAELAAMGLVGFDLGAETFFHRVLPFDPDRVASLNPRLEAAEKLLATGAVQVAGELAEISSGGVTHRVRRDGEKWRCTCPWFARNGGQRGPCKHVLATEMYLERQA
ncbi:SWIM zinc finger family protein [uncultured Roseobacter sp.]|uniref:SWIM zinc finger family protein n=1 Tax=uncultured Roseobacter sp. TaxID=114847 RepID=UPI0026209D51|nr:SWIM zinc finger family protein [uncultured Roseobacter sp.]